MVFKDFDEFVEVIKDCGFKCVEADYNKSTVAPYLVYFKDEEEGIFADGKPIFTNAKIIVELYTVKDDHTSETKFEKWMSENGLDWKKPNRAWDTANKLCVTYYNLSVVFKG